MFKTLRYAAFRHGYLIVVAAWLYTISFIANNYLSYTSSPKKVQQKLQDYVRQNEKRFAEIAADSSILQAITNSRSTSITKTELVNENLGLFVYSKENSSPDTLRYWNSNKFYVAPEDLHKQDGNYFVRYQNGDFEFIKQTIRIKAKGYLLIGMVPIRWDYFIENKYLKAGFANFNKIEGLYEIVDTSNALPIYTSSNQPIFKIRTRTENSIEGYDVLTIVLRTTAVVLLFMFIISISNEVSKTNGPTRGFSLLAVSTFLLRLLTYLAPFPFNFSELQLFDPSIYASNFLHPSLGDLLVNAILVFALINFYKANATSAHTSSSSKKWVPYLNLTILTALALLFAAVVRSLVLDSKISFDVSSFFSLNIFTLLSFVVLCLLLLSFFYLSHILLKAVYHQAIALHVQLLVTAIAGLIFLSLNMGSPSAISNLFVLAWLFGYLVIAFFRKPDIHLSILRSNFFIFWLLFFALSIATLVLYQNRNIELEQRKKYAENLSLQADPASENLLSFAASNFSDTFLITNYPRLQSESSNKYIKDSLIGENFTGYLNKYDSRIYTFDSLFHPLFNDDSVTYASIRTIILNQGKETSIAGLYSYDNANKKASYFFEKKIEKNGNLLGYLFVSVKPKRYKSEALYPELFRQAQDINADFNTGYTYAVYNNEKLVNHNNDYSFPLSLENTKLPMLRFEMRSNGSFNELWYKAGNGKVVIVARRNAWSMELITLFAYLFCVFIAIISLFHFSSFLLQSRFSKKQLKSVLQFNIRSQIHATIIFISVFSFLIIGISTISFFIYRFNQNNEERLSRAIQAMANELDEKLNPLHSQLAFDDVVKDINEPGLGNKVEKILNEVSEVHNVEANYYASSGKLTASTQPYIYNKHLLSECMDPIAYYELSINRKVHYIHSEKIGRFNFLSIYIPVSNEEGETVAYLNIPYLNSQAELNQEISGFLATLINLNAFIFLLAGAIAFMVTNRITSSFSLITKKMQEINIGKVNEEIKWDKQDEIGVLVNEYNKMVNKLEQSAKALAQSEREGAWREMARQVAHEIKNPLTPMKLSIQYLQRAINNNAANVQQLSRQVAETLVQQIDQLSNIAGDFSQFANIGNSKPEKFDLSEILIQLVQLHQSNENLSINYGKEEGNYFVYADRIQIARLFTNLLKNAIEAAEEKGKAIILIHQKIISNNIQISVQDNGSGIPKEMLGRIFTPNFTTKTSGTGLGLAICKGIAENANGKIWFETEEGRGTTFFVEIPLTDNA